MPSAPAAAPLQLDARAWQQCVSTLHHELGRIATREDCQDAIQEALAEALHQPELSIENLGGWVLAIARRRILDKHRAAVGRHKGRRQRRTFVAAALVGPAEQRISETEPSARPGSIEAKRYRHSRPGSRRPAVDRPRMIRRDVDGVAIPCVCGVSSSNRG